jgi:hypothetical protein
MDGFWSWFGRIDNFLGVLTTFFAGYTYVRIRQLVRKAARATNPVKDFRQLIRAHEGITSLKPVALTVSLTPNIGSIKSSVESFIKANKWSMPIEEIDMNGVNGPAELEQYFNLLREKKRLIEAAGYTEMHLFLSAPMPACALAGSLFDNWLPVKLYQKTTDPAPHNYQYWMPLVKHTFGPVIDAESSVKR